MEQKAISPSRVIRRGGRRRVRTGGVASTAPASRARLARSAAAQTSAGTTTRCTRTSPPAPATRPPTAAPTSPPMLHAACSEESTGCGSRRSTSTPCAFMPTSTSALAAPSANPATTSAAEAGRQPHQGEGHGVQHQAGAGGRTAAVTRHQRPRRREGAERARGDREEREPQLAVAQVQAVLDRGDARGERPHVDAVGGEHHREGPSRVADGPRSPGSHPGNLTALDVLRASPGARAP